MKKVIIIISVFLLFAFFIINKQTQQNKPVMESYPWQITLLADGRSRVFGIVLDETSLKEVDQILNSTPKLAVFESNENLALEAYYKNASVGGLIGSFIFTLDVPVTQLEKIRKESSKKKRTESNNIKYELDKPTSDKAKELIVKNLIYIPTVQLDEETIVKRFGQPSHKIKLTTKEEGWHYLYKEKGLDLIYKAEAKEVLQYVSPKNFNLLLAPLRHVQTQ